MMILDREDFRSWLKSFNPLSSVGNRNKTDHCPLAQYTKFKYRADWASVGHGTIFVHKDNDTLVVQQEEWMRQFTYKVDLPLEGAVRAYEVLEILDSIP